eukprot:COSAG01_NODE_62928_length_282_cov_0.841530_1_plen_69_part_10
MTFLLATSWLGAFQKVGVRIEAIAGLCHIADKVISDLPDCPVAICKDDLWQISVVSGASRSVGNGGQGC